MISNLLDK
ncbi:UNVERIFIED_CONTAM: hypothetical protein GTU68_045322 [Idotea baltica]|nr:hypothetical protein [Idotea baltica]